MITTIKDVRSRLLVGKPEAGVTFGPGAYDAYSMVLVEVEDSDGRIGYGEALARRGGEMTAVAVTRLLRDVLIGADPRDIEGLWNRMLRTLRSWGHTTGVVMEAISGVDTALWDLGAKRAGLPLYKFLGGAGRTVVPCYASSVYISDVSTMVEEAKKQQALGFRRLKVKIGRPEGEGGQDSDAVALRAIRDAVGAEMELVVDANGVYTASEALRMARLMEPLDIRWFEEPVPMDDIGGYEWLHSMTSVPLARGETDFGIFTFREVLNRRLIDVVQPDLGRCGGVTGARHAWTLAFAQNISFAPHTGFSGGVSQLAAVHVAAAAPELLALEYMFIDNPLREIFVGGYPVVSDGHMVVPDGPGLGLELDHALVEEFTTFVG